jgi:hypothetical protein
MMEQMFLDDDELKSMTKRVQRAAQAKMLRSMGIAFKHRADGTLAVLRAHVEKEFGAGKDRQPKVKDFVPNWGGLNA